MIDKCPRCNVEIDKSLKNCPLCGAFIEREEIVEDFPNEIDYSFPKVNRSIVFKEVCLGIVIYAFLISIGICFLVNFLAAGKIMWAYHILFGWFVFWCTIARALFFHLDIRKQVCWYSIFACIICFYIQSMMNKAFVVPELQNWALLYATPAFLMGGIAFLFTHMLIAYKDWERLSMPLTAMCVVTAIPVIMSAIMYHRVHFMLCISLGVGIITLLLMMVIGREKYFLELKKKFFL